MAITKFDISITLMLKWNEWIEYRKSIKKPYKSEATVVKQIRWLQSFDESTAIAIIDTSIRQGWQGLFEPSKKTNGKTPNNIKRQSGTTSFFNDIASEFAGRSDPGSKS